MTQSTEQARLERMVQNGSLTREQAARLQNSLDRQNERDQAFLGAMIERRAARRRLRFLLGFCLVFFLAGALAAWWLTAISPGESVAAIVPATESTPSAGGRLVDLAALNEERNRTMNPAIKLSGAVFVAIVLALIGALLVWLYNSLIEAREQVNGGWAQVENVYQRRLDLVPLLIDGVKTYVEHERETLTALTEARAEALGMHNIVAGKAPDSEAQVLNIEAAQDKLSTALARLFAVVENYPDLKASRNFLTLQDQIEGTENRIAIERRNFNEFARRYNARLQKFPHNLVAAALGFESKPYFQAQSAALEGLQDPFGRSRD